ncbi:MAG TPA: ATP-binding protein [Thermoanaerobaculia bacterium]|nr:ATP-binding protein [Thermoanaerobaculia bacterium]
MRGLSLRAKVVLYLVLIHLVLGAISFLALRENRWLLLAVEGLFVLSIALGWMLVRSFFVPLDLIRTGAELMSERDFTSTFREVGQPEMDALIRIYNGMTERLRDERLQLQERNFFLDRLLAASPSGVLTLDFDGRLSSINPSARQLLQVEGDLQGRPLTELGSLGEALAGVPAGESRVVSDGPRRLKVSRAEFFDRGFPRSFLLVEELTEELRASEKAAYGKLIRMMSHEVNNSVGPVSSLLDSFRGYSSALGDEDRCDFEEAIDVAVARMRRLSAFMNGFAEVVRLPEPDRRPCDLRRLLDEIVLLLRPELERRRIRVEWETHDPVPVVELDRNQIEQVLVNVLRNAMESIGEDGRIGLRLFLEADRVVLTISDTGPGIPDDVRPLLFTPFFSTKRDGRGLGLTLVREILTAHGARFGLENRNGGAELRIQF